MAVATRQLGCSYFIAGRLTISGDALLVVFGNIPRTGIGTAYVVALDSGTLRHSTRRGPIQKVAASAMASFSLATRDTERSRLFTTDDTGRS